MNVLEVLETRALVRRLIVQREFMYNVLPTVFLTWFAKSRNKFPLCNALRRLVKMKHRRYFYSMRSRKRL